jgi:hypothetical protein
LLDVYIIIVALKMNVVNPIEMLTRGKFVPQCFRVARTPIEA